MADQTSTLPSRMAATSSSKAISPGRMEHHETNGRWLASTPTLSPQKRDGAQDVGRARIDGERHGGPHGDSYGQAQLLGHVADRLSQSNQTQKGRQALDG